MLTPRDLPVLISTVWFISAALVTGIKKTRTSPGFRLLTKGFDALLQDPAKPGLSITVVDSAASQSIPNPSLSQSKIGTQSALALQGSLATLKRDYQQGTNAQSSFQPMLSPARSGTSS
ncbi:hypothetical protein SAMN02745746_00139 [Pseudogulbenkiania subflava DSM 22618]|uniref:Uncharacterized protein n=1 Tax=Pseudogulbenkiania subflava DSM 22618 TaxID=1123014 RepID=A0A1Y6B7S3_9NEIS|nr:hypothetical protein SAMN02745746_00139 [Pseudogulbenkiania subflava DSM 22618]